MIKKLPAWARCGQPHNTETVEQALQSESVAFSLAMNHSQRTPIKCKTERPQTIPRNFVKYQTLFYISGAL